MNFKIKEKDSKNVVHVYPYEPPYLETTLQVSVKYLDEDLLSSMRKKCMETTWVNHQKTQELNVKAMNKLLIKESLQDITDLTPRALKYLIEPNVELELDKGTSWDTPCKFNEEVKSVIADHINFNFFAFLQDKSRDAEALVNAQELGEKENLSPTSGTAKKDPN